MADQNQFYEILNCLLSYDNDQRTEAEVSEQIAESNIFSMQKLSNSFVV